MAANSTLRAAQCVPLRCRQLSLVTTKTHKTKTMASSANPALLHEAGILGLRFTPSQLHSNAAISTLADQTLIETHTVGKLYNNSGKSVTLIGQRTWLGAENTPYPQTILDQEVGEFRQSADSGDGGPEGCVAALAYKLAHDDNELKWIIAWSNPRGLYSKVYTSMFDGPFYWSRIKTKLDEIKNRQYEISQFGYDLKINIDKRDALPTVKACINVVA